MTAKSFSINWPAREEVEQELLPLVKPTPTSEAEREKLIADLTRLARRYKSFDMANWERECAWAIVENRKRISQAVDLLRGVDNGDSELEAIVESLCRVLEKNPDLKPAKRRRGAPRKRTARHAPENVGNSYKPERVYAGIGDTGCASRMASAVWNLGIRYENGKKQSAASMSKLAKREKERKKEKERDKKKRNDHFWGGDKIQ